MTSRLRDVPPRDHDATVHEFEHAFDARRSGERQDGSTPHVDALLQRARLSHPRDDDDRCDRQSEEEVLVLREEEDISVLQSLADSRIRCASPSERDDVVRLDTVSVQTTEQAEREVLVEQDPHDAWRTAGGRCAAMWAA